MQITVTLLRKFAGKSAKADILKAIADHAGSVLPRYGISTPLRMQQFFAQIAHESGGFTIREESLTYTTTARLRAVWPSRFKSDAQARPFVRNPQLLGNTVYASRMGNGSPSSGDGYRYRGRGLAQHTGKDGYAAIEKITGLPLVAHPDLVNAPEHMLECAAAFWRWKKLGPDADRDDIVAVTKKWNGGTIGLADRKAWLSKARHIFTEAVEPAQEPSREPEADPSTEVRAKPDPAPRANPESNPVVPTGVPEETIVAVQKLLVEMGYHEVGIIGDKPGGRTAAAIAAFKTDRGLSGDPVIDDALVSEVKRAALEGFKRPIAKERKEATAEDVAPKIDTVKQTWWSRLWAKLIAIPGMILAGLGALKDSFDTAREYVQPVFDFASDHIPWWAPVGAAAAIGIVIWISQRKAEQSTIDAYREGRLLG